MVQKELQPNIWHQMLDFHLIPFLSTGKKYMEAAVQGEGN